MSAAAAPEPQHAAVTTLPLLRPASKMSMSISQTYYLAHKARAKLFHEAIEPDHRLRLLVGHANLLDSLILNLADVEREQERWFSKLIHGASKSKTVDRHVQWADRMVEQPEGEHKSDSSGSRRSSIYNSGILRDRISN